MKFVLMLYLNENKIAAKLSLLIEHPEKNNKISKTLRNFIEKQHDYKTIATKYLACWKLNLSFKKVKPI